MKLYEVQLSLTSPFKTNWQGDILFGHMAWAYRERFGEEHLTRWLETFKEDPPFVLSDGFITNTLPRPMIPPPKRSYHTKKEMIDNIRQGKKIKKQLLVHVDDFRDFLGGKPLTFSDEVQGSFKSVVETHNTIDRIKGTSLDENGLYEEESIFLCGCDTISFFVRVKDECLTLFLELLNQVALSGYGKKRNIGYGQFFVKKCCERADLDSSMELANGVVWISHGVPSANDPTNGWYKLQTKYGKLGGNITGKGTVFKKPLTRIIPGAVFITDDPKPYYGQMISNISPFNPTVVQYAYALALPVKLPEYLQHEE
ncbi:type III-A CRISPR-associated RAMP protein Csm4 [Calidifontibacillus erzurumensis]|uniref:CRISPR system Cms protein Csm4 n=1 Tax=Calidifontibacillus erzurumensis TaxID=2741433 RepID=A0A8J8GJR8_9BACI|nr:RAMP superfamily CRISPR-associated protein [Calidifontibacillus erzurumensis]NSL53041.1 hypothetical protein [Calidifontibacillus erzurumensis]